MLTTQIFERNYPVLSSFRKPNDKAVAPQKVFTKSKGGWRCGDSFIPKKSKCYTDPVTGKKLKEPTTYNQYRKKRAESVKRKAKGQPLTDKERVYVRRVERDREKLKSKNFQAKTKQAVKKVGYSSNVLSGGIADVDPQKIQVDPKRFQYKIAGANTKSGSVGSLAGVKKYDPNLAGIIQVWADTKDGNTYVVNGHNRLAFEKKMGVKKRPARFLDVKSAKEARAVGALTNIAEGRGNARDAAKFFRDSGISREDLEKRGVPLREKIATDGIAMSRLSDGLFNQVIQGDLPESRAVVIGDKLKDHTQQEALVKLIAKEEKRGRRITNDVISELADMTGTAPKQQEGGNLLTMLGFDPDERSLALEKAEISASVKRQLNKDKKLFGTVGKGKAATELKRGGNKINIDMSAAISQSASTTLTLFEKQKFNAGKIDNILNESAERLANGEKREKVAKEARQEIEEYLKDKFKYGRRSPKFSREGESDRASQANFRRENKLIQFAKEKVWRCGNGFIPISKNCYINQKTGKIRYKYVKNPKTGRRNKVKLPLTYKEYRKARTKAIKKLGQNKYRPWAEKRLSETERGYVHDSRRLRHNTRIKKYGIWEANKKYVDDYVHPNILKAEDKIRQQNFETVKIFDDFGNELFSKDGGQYSIGFEKHELPKFKDKIMTHNHPAEITRGGTKRLINFGSSFSGNDIIFAAENDVKELRVVTPQHRFSLKRPLKGWYGNLKEEYLDDVINYFERDINKKIGKEVSDSKIFSLNKNLKGGIDIHDYLWANKEDLRNVKIAKYIKAPYKKVPWKKAVKTIAKVAKKIK